MKSSITPGLDLILERIVPLKPEVLWKAWTDPVGLLEWFCPKPWKTVECEMELYPGGLFKTVMESPEGERFPNVGCFLEVVENRRLVWTDALLPGFRPVTQPASGAGLLFTAFIHLDPHAEGTLYRAVAKHKDQADCQRHADMGFHEGWGIVFDQLIKLAKT